MLAPQAQVLSVTQITREIRSLLEEQIGDVWVEGEISNHRLQSSGHQYFTLKDEGAQISCVMFRSQNSRQAPVLRDGMKVQAYGEVTVYEQRGNYQIIVRTVQPKGLGTLQQRFEALKQRLAAEGLFESQWKKPLPRLPRVVALVTSPTGAALRDMLHILTRRAPWLRVLIYPVRVQGQGADQEIVRALEHLNRAEGMRLPRPDVIVVGRGGGSLEDLWNFNEESVARAIFASKIPVISAVGHEIDFTISDFVADLRAPTPSAAAELLAPDMTELRHRLDTMAKALSFRVTATLDQHEQILNLTARGALRSEPSRQLRDAEQSLDDLEGRLSATTERRTRDLDEALSRHQRVLDRFHPARKLAEVTHRLDLLQHRITAVPPQHLETLRQRVRSLRQLLTSLGPDAVLERGFSLTLDAKGKPVLDAKQVSAGDVLVTKVAHGRISSVVAPDA